MKRRDRSRAALGTLVIVASLPILLSACGPASNAPPPFLPYRELSKEETAQADGAIGNMRASQHGTVPAIALIEPLSLDPHASGRHAILTIQNGTSCRLGFYLRGPQHWVFGIGARESGQISLDAGRYTFAIDTHDCGGVTFPLYSERTIQPKHEYLLSLSSDDVGRGELEVTNNTGAPITVNVAGENYVSTGSEDWNCQAATTR